MENKRTIETNLYRDLNAKFVKERRRDGSNSWWTQNPNLIFEAEKHARAFDNFITNDFFSDIYWNLSYQKWLNGKYTIIGKPFESVFKGDTMPFIQKNKKVLIKKNKTFLIHGTNDNKRFNIGPSIIDNCHYSGHYKLTDSDKTEIAKYYPNFSFKILGEYVFLKNEKDFKWGSADLIGTPLIEHKKGNNKLTTNFKKKFVKIICSNTKYKDYLNSKNGVYFFDSDTDVNDLKECEKVFDEEVFKIKKLVNDIGEVTEVNKVEHLN